jgi:hypothetical protein
MKETFRFHNNVNSDHVVREVIAVCSTNHTKSAERFGVAIALLTCIPEVLGSYLGRDSEY